MRQSKESRRKSCPASLGVLFSLISVSLLAATLAIPITSQNGNAAMWNPVFELSSDTGSEEQYNPAIAVNGTEVHVVWEDWKDGDDDIYYRFFNGTDWEPEQELSVDAGIEYQEVPSIAVEGEKIHVTWLDSRDGDPDVVYRYFNGTDWDTVQEISSDVGTEMQWDPSIAVEGDKVHVAWIDRRDGDRDVYYRLFNGTDWEPIREISTDVGTEDQWHVSVGAGNNMTHVVWTDFEDGDPDIYCRLFNGTDWEPIQEISADVVAEGQRDPSIAVEGDKVHVAWMDMRDGDFDVVYRHFNGTDWEPIREISTDVGTEDQWYPSVDVDGGYVHIVWENWNMPDMDIFYRIFDGADWQQEQEISLDIGTELQRKPSIAANGTSVHVVWQDERDGDYDIYYRMGIDDFISPQSNANPILPYVQTVLPFDVGWTATDDHELANVSLHYRYSPDNSSWLSWEEWAYNSTISGTSANGVFSFPAPYGDGFYEFLTVANDSSGNGEAAPAGADALAKVDATPSPPDNPEAFLGGSDFGDVVLAWNLSPDDGGGKNNVARYDLFRGSTYDAGGALYILHDSVPAGSSSYVDVQAGEGDPSSYFYRICAVGSTGPFSCSLDQVGKFTRPLPIGPNLVSMPFIQSDETIGVVLQTLIFDSAWVFDSINGEWRSLVKSKPYGSNLKYVNHTIGFWVNVTENSNLTVAGTVPSNTTISFYKGWNLIGFPSFNSSHLVADLKSSTGSSRIEGWNPLSVPYHLRGVGDLETLEAGYGYWVWVDSDTTWIVKSS